MKLFGIVVLILLAAGATLSIVYQEQIFYGITNETEQATGVASNGTGAVAVFTQTETMSVIIAFLLIIAAIAAAAYLFL